MKRSIFIHIFLIISLITQYATSLDSPKINTQEVFSLDTEYTISTTESDKILEGTFSVPENQTGFLSIYCITGEYADDVTFTVTDYEDKEITLTPLLNGKIASINATLYQSKQFTLKCGIDYSSSFIKIKIRTMGSEIESEQSAEFGKLYNENPEECFSTSKLTINSEYVFNLLTKNGNLAVYTKDSNEEETLLFNMKYRSQKSYVLEKSESISYICMKCIDNCTNDAVSDYSIQLLQYESGKTVEPQMNGQIYSYMLTNGQTRYFKHYKHHTDNDKISFNVREEAGFINAYLVSCTSTDCSYTKSQLESASSDKVQAISNINGFFSLSVDTSDDKPIRETDQEVLYVACTSDVCNVTVFFYDPSDNMYLDDSYQIIQVINSDETDTYGLEIFESSALLEVKLTIFSGDAVVEVQKTGETIPEDQIDKLSFGNSEVVNIEKVNTSDFSLVGKYTIAVNAISGSFYSISYTVTPENLEGEKVYKRNVGYAYTEYAKNGTTKLYLIHNRYASKTNKLLVTVSPDNANISPKHGENESCNDFFEQEKFNQKVLLNSTSYMHYYKMECISDFYDYCKFYLTAVPITDDAELVISEGLLYETFISSDVPSLRFLYPKTTEANFIFANTKLEIPSGMKMTISVNGNLYNDTIYEFTQDRSFVLYKDKLNSYCKDLELCSVLFNLKFESKLDLETHIPITFNVRTNRNNPTPLIRQKQIEDIVYDTGLSYFYFDVFKGEEGEIVVNFNRGSGKIIGKLVNKGTIESNSDWRNRVRLPKKEDEETNSTYKDELLSNYNSFTKTLKYTKDDTEKCENVCELYLAVVSTEEYFSSETLNTTVNLYFINDFNIYTAYLNEMSETVVYETVLIPTNDYVYGVLDTFHNENNVDYYVKQFSVFLPMDGDELIIDFIGSHMQFTISGNGFWEVFTCIGGDCHFSIPRTGQPFTDAGEVYIVIEALNLDQIYYAPFAFRIYVPNNYSEDQVYVPQIIDSPFNQRVFCNVNNKDEPCYFLIPKYSTDYLTNLMVYSYSEDNYDIEIYMKKIKMANLDIFDAQELKDSLPTKDSYDSKSDKKLSGSVLSVLLTDEYTNNLFLFFAVYSSGTGTIAFINTIRNFIQKTSINTHTWNLFSVGIMDPTYQQFTESNLILSIPTDYNSLLHITNINGRGSFVYGDFEIGLNYAGDSMAATIHKTDEKLLREITMNSKYLTELGFYIYTTVRGELNLDMLEIGTSTQFIYTPGEYGEFPVGYYTQVSQEMAQDYLLNFQINYLLYQGEYDEKYDDFLLKATVAKHEEVLKKSKNSSYEIPDLGINGLYSKITRSGRIIIDGESIKSVDSQYPNMIVNIEKSEKNTNSYTAMNLQIQYIALHDYSIPVPINQYYDSLLLENTVNNIHRLPRTNSGENYMKIEFAKNSEQIDFALLTSTDNYSPDKKSFKSEIEYETISKDFGKTSMLLQLSDEQSVIYLVVYTLEETAVTNTNLTSYTFKYQTSSTGDYARYKEGSSNPIAISDYDPIKIRIDTITFQNGTVAPGKYYISHLDPEEAEAKQVTKHTISPNDLEIKGLSIVTVTTEKEIIVELDNFDSDSKNYVYIMTILDNDNERLAYDIFVPADYKMETKIGIIVLCVIVAVVIISIVIIFCIAKRYSNKAGSLKEKIEVVSFATGKDKEENVLENVME